MAEVGTFKIVKVALAGLFIVAALVAHYTSLLPRGATVICSLASLVLTGFPIVFGAITGLLRLKSNVDELVSIAIVASLLLGDWIPASVVAFIMVLGSLIEEYVSSHSRRHIEAMCANNPDHALLIEPDGTTREVAVGLLMREQLVLVRPGDVIAVDGIVEDGESSVDEAMLTGESAAVDKAPGDRVSCGTINRDGALRVRVERVGEETTHGKILNHWGLLCCVGLCQTSHRQRRPSPLISYLSAIGDSHSLYTFF